MFEKITAAPADPILGLTDIFRADARPNKINLGIGVYKDETGKTPVLTSVKKAEQYLLENEATKNYLGIEGIPAFANCTQELLFGKQSPIIADKRARTAQTPGGTGGLRVAADFIANQTSAEYSPRLWPAMMAGILPPCCCQTRKIATEAASNAGCVCQVLFSSSAGPCCTSCHRS